MLYPKKEEIQNRRKVLKLSQRQLCAKAGLPNNAVSRFEDNIKRYTFPIRAKAIAEALECDIQDIFDEVTK